MAATNYPPEGFYKNIKFGKKDFEHIILWMLANNEDCQWSCFTQKPLEFTTSTLSKYLNLLKSKDFVDNFARGQYKITSEGRKRFHEISSTHGAKKKLNYPPGIVTKKRIYEDWILWMVYNNNLCRWSHFLEPPLAINQSSLSKKINLLLNKEFIVRENKEYRITNSGKIEYSKMLQTYDLDRQSILNEESKRIDEITITTIKFFDEYNVEDENIQFMYLTTILKLDYDRVKSMLTNQTDFEKIILFISINHPDQYPNYVSLKDFADIYEINQSKLEYYIDEIVENRIYPIKFFTLKPTSDSTYYFQENGKVESMLRTITENHITKFTYLNRLFSSAFDAFTIEKAVLEEICGYFFNNALRESLRKFLPSYINYLAYKIEAKVELKETYDKLDAIIWQNMIDIFQTRSPKDLEYQFIGQSEINYQLDTVLLELLKPYYREKLETQNRVCQHLIGNKEYNKALESIEDTIKTNKNDRVLTIVKAIVLCYLNRNEDALALLKGVLKLPQNKDRILLLAYFLTVFSSLAIGDFNRAINLANKIVVSYPKYALSHATKGLTLAYNLIYKFDDNRAKQDYGINDLDKAIALETFQPNIALLFMLKSRVVLELNKFEEAIELIDKGISIVPNKVDLYRSKTTILMYFNEYPQLLDLLDDMLGKFPKIEKDLKMKKASVYKLLGNLDAGFKIVRELLEKNPEDKELLSFIAYWYQYLNKKEEALNTIEALIKSEQDNGGYYDSYGEILMNYEEYEKAVEQFQKAIKLRGSGWFIYQTYIKLGICFRELGNYDLAIEYLKKGKEFTNKSISDHEIKKKWLVIADIFLTEIEGIQF
ncbi:MAG: tetratricopeptide repeat protein [Promethearchaeota archaeon]|nr:MAG: tetratricopeptide repeat protein [Candidatus Lokiarchaeota archaeon]